MDVEVQKALIALVLGLVSWLAKDVIFNQRKERIGLIVAEHRKRLEEIWSPLYFYTSLILMDSNKRDRWDHPGVHELQDILEKSVHIIPTKHFKTLVKLLEGRTEQNTLLLDLEEYKSTKLYIFKQIQISDYIVFKKYIDFNPILEATTLPNLSSAMRQFNGLVINLLIWAGIAAIFYIGVYLIKNSIYWVLLLIFMFWVFIFIRDIYLRSEREKFLRND